MVSSTLPIQDYQYLHGVSCLAIYNEDMATHGIYKDFGVAVHDALDMQYSIFGSVVQPTLPPLDPLVCSCPSFFFAEATRINGNV